MIETILIVLLILILISMFVPGLAGFRVPGGVLGLILLIVLIWVLVGGGGS
ncbi:MAG: DUF3309 domain-containing protein [Actinomycetota bacterium]|nr:DUF3309 domain-containing protein [Actinomycetota bacterium]